jgi:murein DD-endopeptidase MepM/ murein hydrolase activator NlpD
MVVIARGDEIRHFTVRPWVVALVGSVLAALAIGYLLATSYLVLRDDLIGASIARQARLQQAYEDRISALRAQVDRITSRQMLDQQLMENKVSELLDRQSRLSERNLRLDPLLRRAGANGSPLPQEAPLPKAKPDLRAGIQGEVDPANPLRLAGLSPSEAPFALTSADHADQLFIAISQSLRQIERQQLKSIRSLTENAYETVEAITETLRDAGLPVDIDYGEQDVGGPFLTPTPLNDFETEVTELDEALSTLDRLKEAATKLPIANPAPGRPVSSGFGMRQDPFLRRPAHHSGIDFRASRGQQVLAAGAGVVVNAGWAGGYGRMVEIDHGNGLVTRYAHLNAIKVEKGASVDTGTVIGLVGSSGRSTGPHLHYEVRKKGRAVNPVSFLKAGKKLSQYL